MMRETIAPSLSVTGTLLPSESGWKKRTPGAQGFFCGVGGLGLNPGP